MKVNIQKILELAIEAGIQRGWRKAHKHLENPEENVIQSNIHDCIMGEIYEYFTFDD